MPRSLALVLVLLASAVLAACGEDEDRARDHSRAVAIRLPADLDDACRDAARGAGAAVLCPPSGGRPAAFVEVRHADLAPEPCAYLVNLDTLRRDPRDARPFHVLVGGACVPFALGADGGRWAVDPPTSLRLAGSPPLVLGQPPRVTRPHVLRELRVRGHAGLLLRSDPFPEGGLHGGHYALVWNEDGRGRAISVHYGSGDRERPPRPDQVEALQRLAGSLRRVSG